VSDPINVRELAKEGMETAIHMLRKINSGSK